MYCKSDKSEYQILDFTTRTLPLPLPTAFFLFYSSVPQRAKTSCRVMFPPFFLYLNLISPPPFLFYQVISSTLHFTLLYFSPVLSAII